LLFFNRLRSQSIGFFVLGSRNMFYCQTLKSLSEMLNLIEEKL
jgi:hypothetical protein